MQYYVVKNKETGMYFRGKGANMWGKYYNQASIYRFRKHAENAVEERAYRGEQAEVVEIQITEGAVTDTNVGNKWIPCSERMPKPEDFGYKPVDIIAAPCLVSVNNLQIGQYVTAAMYHFIRKEFIPCLADDEVDDDIDVLAWMLTPEPYREDDV